MKRGNGELLENIDNLCKEALKISVPESNPLFSQLNEYKRYCKLETLKTHIEAEHFSGSELETTKFKNYGTSAIYETAGNLIGYIIMGLCLAVSNIILYPITVDIIYWLAEMWAIDVEYPPVWFSIVAFVIQFGFFIFLVYLLILFSLWMNKRKKQHEIVSDLQEILLYAKNC